MTTAPALPAPCRPGRHTFSAWREHRTPTKGRQAGKRRRVRLVRYCVDCPEVQEQIRDEGAPAR